LFQELLTLVIIGLRTALTLKTAQKQILSGSQSIKTGGQHQADDFFIAVLPASF